MINWTVRFKNAPWLYAMIALIVTFVYDFLSLLGIAPKVEQGTVIECARTILTLLGMIGVIQDPTTAGLGDSERALKYTEPYKDAA